MKTYQLYASNSGLEIPLMRVKATSIEDAIRLGEQAYGIWKQWFIIAKKVGA